MHIFERIAKIYNYIFSYRKKEIDVSTKKLPAVPESVLKKRKRREAVKAARLQISIKVITYYIFKYLSYFSLIKCKNKLLFVFCSNVQIATRKENRYLKELRNM